MLIRVCFKDDNIEITQGTKPMGDISTHAVFYSFYWHLAFLRGDSWINSQTGEYICDKDAAARLVNLSKQ